MFLVGRTLYNTLGIVERQLVYNKIKLVFLHNELLAGCVGSWEEAETRSSHRSLLCLGRVITGIPAPSSSHTRATLGQSLGLVIKTKVTEKIFVVSVQQDFIRKFCRTCLGLYFWKYLSGFLDTKSCPIKMIVGDSSAMSSLYTRVTSEESLIPAPAITGGCRRKQDPIIRKEVMPEWYHFSSHA